jgi:hypothetical protein
MLSCDLLDKNGIILNSFEIYFNDEKQCRMTSKDINNDS